MVLLLTAAAKCIVRAAGADEKAPTCKPEGNKEELEEAWVFVLEEGEEDEDEEEEVEEEGGTAGRGVHR